MTEFYLTEACPVCFAEVHTFHKLEHEEWHRTMTNRPNGGKAI